PALLFQRSHHHVSLHPLPTRRSSDLVAPRRYEKLAGLVVLLDRFVRSILPLQQEGVARNALGGLLCRNGTKKPVVDGQRFAFILDRKSTRLNSSHGSISYAVFCLKKK